jgi:hypothetical protein
MTLQRGKEAQRLGLQVIRWKEVQREMHYGRALGRSRDSEWDHGQALEISRKRGACDTEVIKRAFNSSKSGARDTEEIEGVRDSRKICAHKRSREIQLFMLRLSTPHLEGTE